MKKKKLDVTDLVVLSFQTDPFASPDEAWADASPTTDPTPMTWCRICPTYNTDPA